METNFNLFNYNLTASEVKDVKQAAKEQGISEEKALENLFPEAVEEANQSEEAQAEEYAKYAELVSNAKNTNAANATTATNEADSVQSTAATGSSTAIQEEIDKLTEKREANIAEMEELEAEIEELAEEAEAQIAAAIQAQEEAVEQHEEDTEKAVDAELQKYIEANKNGDGMSRDELKANMANALGNIPNISDSIANIIDATASLDKMDSKLGELEVLINDTKSIDNELANLEVAKEAAAASEAAAKCCDPIGFTMEDENGQQVQYDFIVDDGNFDSTSDFLGAEGQWSEMEALNTDGDNTVSADEMAAGNIKAVKTNADGTQEVVDIKEEFGEDFSIDLASYKQGGSHSAVSNGDHDNDGVADQTLLGTFNVNVNGQSISGYNTLDDVDYLSETFGVSAGEQVNAAAAGSAGVSEDLNIHEEFLETYKAEYEKLSQELDNAWSGLDVSKDTMTNFRETSKAETMNEAEEEKATIEAEQEQEAENVKQDGEFLARAAEANNVTEDELTEEQIDRYYEEEYAA